MSTGAPGGYREPMFNAPAPVMALVGVLVAAWLAQTFLAPDAIVAQLALSRTGLQLGLWHELVTHVFLHGGITHLAMNAIGAVAFGAPVVRLLGQRNGDIALFYAFFLICGALGGLGFIALNGSGDGLLMGASGAVSGLWGAASRLIGRRGDLAPIFDRQVLGMALGFAVVNVVIGLLAPLIDLHIGWQAHLAGYGAGLLLIGAFGRLAGRLR